MLPASVTARSASPIVNTLKACAVGAGYGGVAGYGAGEGEVRIRVQRPGQPVHGLAPGPEGAAVSVRAPPQGAVEGVRVRVGEAGEHEPVEAAELGGSGVVVVADEADHADEAAGDEERIEYTIYWAVKQGLLNVNPLPGWQ